MERAKGKRETGRKQSRKPRRGCVVAPSRRRTPNTKAWDVICEMEEVVRELRAGMPPEARRRVLWD